MREKNPEVNIRPMSDEDIPIVIALEKLISTEQNLLSEKDLLATELPNKHDYNFVAEVDKKTIGAIIAHLEYVMIPLIEVCMIQGFFVHPDFQNQGIGRKLVEAVLDYCRTEEIYTVRAYVPRNNSELMRLFEQIGFHSSNIINMDKIFEV